MKRIFVGDTLLGDSGSYRNRAFDHSWVVHISMREAERELLQKSSSGDRWVNGVDPNQVN